MLAASHTALRALSSRCQSPAARPYTKSGRCATAARQYFQPLHRCADRTANSRLRVAHRSLCLVPTIAEAYPARVAVWYGMLRRPNTPSAIVDQLCSVAAATQHKLLASSRGRCRTRVSHRRIPALDRRENVKWKRIIDQRGIQPSDGDPRATRAQRRSSPAPRPDTRSVSAHKRDEVRRCGIPIRPDTRA